MDDRLEFKSNNVSNIYYQDWIKDKKIISLNNM